MFIFLFTKIFSKFHETKVRNMAGAWLKGSKKTEARDWAYTTQDLTTQWLEIKLQRNCDKVHKTKDIFIKIY
jgi:hypothetical protein